MLSFNQLVTAIISALLIGATIVFGLTAVENAVISMKNSRKQTAIEYCYAKVESQKPTNIDDRNSFQLDCENTEKNKIDANFAQTLNYISCFKLIVPAASGSSSTSEEILSAAGATCNL